MNKRKRNAFETWKDAQKALAEFGRAELRLERKSEKAERKIQSVKERLGEESAVLLTEIACLRQELERFFRRNSRGAKTKTLPEGKLEIRLLSRLEVPRPARTSRRLIERGLGDCLKLKESLDRRALARLDDDTLLSVGARRVVREVFYVRPARERR